MTIVRGRVTLEEFLRLPERKPALEFEEGEVIPKMSPKGHHSLIQAEMAELINHAGKPQRIARAFTELRTTFAGRSYIPDISVYRWDRIPATADGKVASDFVTPPDLIVEIASPKQSVTKLVRRCLWFVANGVRIAQLVDPIDESILVFRPGQAPRSLRGTDRIDVPEVLPDFELTAGELFAALHIR